VASIRYASEAGIAFTGGSRGSAAWKADWPFSSPSGGAEAGLPGIGMGAVFTCGAIA
jgi:hypothetical protein